MEFPKSSKKNERRAKKLDEHIHHAENHFTYRTLYHEYVQQKPRKHAVFYESHRAELTLYEAAARYLQQVMNGRTTIPPKAWKAERSTLAGDNEILHQQYILLKKDVREVEIIRSSVDRVVRHLPVEKRSQEHDNEARA